MAPELQLGEEASPRSDIFSFACTIYFAMTGQTPRETPVWDAPVIPPSQRRPELATVDGVLLRALSSAPSDRHASAQELIEDVCAALDVQRTVRQPRTVREEWTEPPPPRRQVSPAEHARPRQSKVRPKPEFAAPSSGPRIRVEVVVTVALILVVLLLVIL
jgi:serine/threonine protein kinase